MKEITKALVRKGSCRDIVAGVIQLTVDSKLISTLDYGTGECDATATLTKDGTTVLLSSHNMLEVELMCDRIVLINDGLIVEQGTPADLKRKYQATNIEEVFMRVVA